MLKKIINSVKKYWDNPGKKAVITEDRETDVWHDKRDLKDENFEFLIRRVIDYDFSDEFEISKEDYQKILKLSKRVNI